MSNLIKAIQQNNPTGLTANGAVTHETSYSACVDFFAIGASSRGKDISKLFNEALCEAPEVALRILQWVRDVRGGAGERQTFRDLFTDLVNKDLGTARRILVKIPELGRWDDVLVAINTPLEPEAIRLVSAGLNTPETASICAKWMPRQGEVAYKLRNGLGMTPKGWRKMLVALSNTVEQKMCAQQWHEIEYGKLPSKAAANYQKAFERNDGNRYMLYREGLVAGTEKINAGAIFPHDVILSAKKGNDTVATAQWEALPNYMEESQERILPLVDVSYSMTCPVGGSTSINCMDAAVALGLYTSERMSGPFAGYFINFHTTPQLIKVGGGSLGEKVKRMEQAPWGGSTNFQAAMNLILQSAVKNNLTQDDLPTMILVLSDMEFNQAESSFYSRGSGKTNFQTIKDSFEAAGYTMPKLIFWNLNGRVGNSAATIHDENVALVSSFSPAILKSVLSAKTVTPIDIMMEAVMIDRYEF